MLFSLYRAVLQSKKSISFTEKAKEALKKGFSGVNQSRMGVSRNLVILPEMKTTEKVNVPGPKTVQVMFFRNLGLFLKDIMKNLVIILEI